MNDKEISLLLDEISAERVPRDVNLLPVILTRIQKEKTARSKSTMKFALSAIASVIVLSVLFFTVPGAASAMRKILGFIPGFGLVDQTTPLRVLAGPANNTREGFTVTVENALIDAEHTVITYKVEGRFEDETSLEGGGLAQVCFSGAELRLPDGTTYKAPDAFPDSSWPSGYRTQDSYPPVPEEFDRAALILPCLHARGVGQEPANWEIPLTFVTAPPHLTVYPVSTRSTPALPSPRPLETATAMPPEASLNLERVIPLPEGQLVQVRVDWPENSSIAGVTIYPEDVKLFDAGGSEIPFAPSDQAIDPNESGGQNALFGFKTAPINSSGPARLVIDAISEVNYKASAAFTFDPGPERRPEQTWELDKDIEIDGRVLHISTITVVEMGGNASLSVEMESSDGIIGAGVFDAARPSVSGSSTTGNGKADAVQYFSSSFNYDGGLPDGPIPLTVAGYTIRLAGPWTLEWMPDASAIETPSTGQAQSPCIAEADWIAAQAGSQAVPDGQNGLILSEDYNTDPATTHLAISKLDGSESRTLIDIGHSAVVSPDGSRLVYMGPEGINILNIETGEKLVIPGTNTITGVFQPFWSPDGARIAYTGTPGGSSPNLYLAAPDGSNPVLLPGDEPIRLMQGWLPDGSILYVGFGESGPALKRLDPQSGVRSALFTVPELSTAISVSRDGTRLALNWREGTEGKQTLFVFSVDGTQRKPLLEVPGEGFIREMMWSPDGEWLLVDLSWKFPDMDYSKALIRVDTCEIIPINGIQGMVASWLP